jgi:hypothetical protein
MLAEGNRVSLFTAIKDYHDQYLAILKDNYLHREVTLLDVWPKSARGRAALIEGIIIQDGVPLFLCMVLRSGSETQFLNSEGWTRSYRPWDDFVVMPDDDGAR